MADEAPTEPPEPQNPPEYPPAVFTCPHCAMPVEIDRQGEDEDEATVVNCPHCEGEFAAGQPTDDESGSSDNRDDELSLLRIKQVSGGRRAAVRARTYLFVGCVLAITGAIKLLIMTVQRIRYQHRVELRTIGFIAGAAACSMLAKYFWRRAAEVTAELSKPLLEEPATPPDFSTLGDGSRVAKDLENIR